MQNDKNKLVWDFLNDRCAGRGRSLRTVGRQTGFEELVVLWEAGRKPHLPEKVLLALETPTGLPRKFLGFLQHFGEEKNISLTEARALAAAHKGSHKRHDAELTPRDYMTMLGELRCQAEQQDMVAMAGCRRCDTPFPGYGRCPNCRRAR